MHVVGLVTILYFAISPTSGARQRSGAVSDIVPTQKINVGGMSGYQIVIIFFTTFVIFTANKTTICLWIALYFVRDCKIFEYHVSIVRSGNCQDG
jgi:hypothetical protein